MTSSFRRILGAAIVGALLTGCFGAAAVRPDEAAAAARSFVEHLALNQPDEAWEMLGLTTREAAYGGDASQFASEVDDADWSRVRWEIDREPRSLDTGWAVFVTVEGGSSAIPDFVIGREIAQPWTSARRRRGGDRPWRRFNPATVGDWCRVGGMTWTRVVIWTEG